MVNWLSLPETRTFLGSILPYTTGLKKTLNHTILNTRYKLKIWMIVQSWKKIVKFRLFVALNDILKRRRMCTCLCLVPPIHFCPSPQRARTSLSRDLCVQTFTNSSSFLRPTSARIALHRSISSPIYILLVLYLTFNFFSSLFRRFRLEYFAWSLSLRHVSVWARSVYIWELGSQTEARATPTGPRDQSDITWSINTMRYCLRLTSRILDVYKSFNVLNARKKWTMFFPW